MHVDLGVGQYVINTHVEIMMKPSHHPIYPALPYLLVALFLIVLAVVL